MAFVPLQYLSNILGLTNNKDTYTRTPVFASGQILNGNQPLWVTVDDKEAEIFNTTPELNMVISRKAQMYSNGIFKHYKAGKNNKVEEVPNSPFIKFLENPNPLQSRNEWLMDELIQKSVYGCSFVFSLKGYNKQEVPSAFYNLPANWMRIIPTGKIYKQAKFKDIISHYELHPVSGEKMERYEVSDIIYSRIQNPENPILGKSPLHPLNMPISNIRGAYGYRNVLINEKGAIGIISSDSRDGEGGGGVPLKRDERQRIENQLTSADYGIHHGMNRIILSGTNLKWSPMTYPTKNLMLFEEISEDLMKIIDMYGLNVHLFSSDKGSTFNNVNEGKKMAYQDTIIPYAEDFTYKLTNYFGLDKVGEWISLDYSHIEVLQENETMKSEVMKRKAEAYRILKDTNDFNTDEIRTLLGL